jgi:hypothetical protein
MQISVEELNMMTRQNITYDEMQKKIEKQQAATEDWNEAISDLKTTLVPMARLIDRILQSVYQALGPFFAKFGIKGEVGKTMGGFSKFVEGIGEKISGIIKSLGENPRFQRAIEGLADSIMRMFDNLSKPEFQERVIGFITKISESMDTVFGIFEKVGSWVASGTGGGAVLGFLGALTNPIVMAVEWLAKLWLGFKGLKLIGPSLKSFWSALTGASSAAEATGGGVTQALASTTATSVSSGVGSSLASMAGPAMMAGGVALAGGLKVSQIHDQREAMEDENVRIYERKVNELRAYGEDSPDYQSAVKMLEYWRGRRSDRSPRVVGGPVFPGQEYAVNEKKGGGGETFRPSAPGKVLPANAGGPTIIQVILDGEVIQEKTIRSSVRTAGVY